MTDVSSAQGFASYEALYHHAPCGLLSLRAGGEIEDVNATFLQWTGYTRDAVVGRPFVSLLDPGSQLFYETRHTPVLHLKGEVREVALSIVTAGGGRLPALVNSTVDPSRPDHVLTAVFDSTARQEYEHDLIVARRAAEASEVRVRVLQSASSAFGIAMSEDAVGEALVSNARDAFSAAHVAVFGLDAERLLYLIAGSNPLEKLVNRTPRTASSVALSTEQTIIVSLAEEEEFPEIVAALRENRLEVVTVTPLLEDGDAMGILVCFYSRARVFDKVYTDLQAALARQAAQALVRIKLQKVLEQFALHDQLTGLANRSLLLEQVTDAIAGAGLTGNPMAVIFLDLDGFKGVNDALGHAVGDAVLTEVAHRIRTVVRMDDAVGRYGGDEFVVVCQDADFAAADEIAARIRAEIALPMEGIPPELQVTASVGVATYVPDADDLPSNDELLVLADDAMYAAKSSGKDQVSHRAR